MEERSEKIQLPSIEEIKKTMESSGSIKGASFRGDLEYILGQKGEEGLKAVEKKAKEWGCPIEYRKTQETEWYPVGLRLVSLSAILTSFNWGKKELAEIAESAPKTSFVVKLFVKYFSIPEKIFKDTSSRVWKRYYSVGSLEAVDFKRSPKGGHAVFQIKDFKLHPLYCFFLGHFVIGLFKLVQPRIKEIFFEETKCMFKGNDHHEYLIKWTEQASL